MERDRGSSDAEKEVPLLMKVCILDVSYLCHRARYSTGGLAFGGIPVGVTFGVLREIHKLLDLFAPTHWVFAFDAGGTGKRGEVYGDYKAHRKKEDRTPEEMEELKAFYQQVKDLYHKHLPACGFKNIIKARGYEADDLIARACEQLHSQRDEGYIISADEDLYQLLRGHISQYLPKNGKIITSEAFRKEYGIRPEQWPNVKAMAGCSSDNIKGIPGVGEKTAVKFLREQLNPSSKKYESILDNMKIHNVNLPLVSLPYNGTPEVTIRDDEFSLKKMRDVESSLGIKSARPRKKRNGFF